MTTLLTREEGSDLKVFSTDYNPSVVKNIQRNVLINELNNVQVGRNDFYESTGEGEGWLFDGER